MPTSPKNVARIEEIRVNMDARVTLSLVTPFFKRLVNREFHIVTAKLFIQLKLDQKKNGNLAKETDEAIKNFAFEVNCVVAESQKYIDNDKIKLSWISVSYPLRLISHQSAALVRLISKADQAAYCLYAAEQANIISKITREEMLAPVELAFNRIKQIAIGFERKSAAEIAQELSIS